MLKIISPVVFPEMFGGFYLGGNCTYVCTVTFKVLHSLGGPVAMVHDVHIWCVYE